MKKMLLLIPILFLIGIFLQSCQDESVVEPNKVSGRLNAPVGCIDNDPTDPVGIVPTKEAFPGGDPVCEGGVRIQKPDGSELSNEEYYSNSFDLDAYGNQVTIEVTIVDCGETFSWSVPSNIVIDYVYAKGGTVQNVYDYTGESPRPTNDANLHCPVNASGGYAGISHIDFCFHYKLDISKTAVPKFTRTYSWTIDKEGDQTELTLSAGQTYTVNYDVTVDATYQDSDWKVEGTITIENNTPLAATITSITDVLTGGINGVYDCGVTFPYDLASGATLECTYSADLSGADNGTNNVTVVTSTSMVEGGVATADYTFGDPTTEVDECIDVTDDIYGALGTVCYDDAPKTYEYTLDISYDECGDFQYVNTASFVTNNTETTGSDSWTVNITVTDCDGGCTLTPGYWKTHSNYGPAPYDDTWAQIGEDTPFFLSGQSYYNVLWTSPAGNAYYILAHAYIAAELNFLNGADDTAAETAFDAATVLFNTYTPAQVAALKGNNSVRAQFISLASTLDSYNNGLIGPGHCSE